MVPKGLPSSAFCCKAKKLICKNEHKARIVLGGSKFRLVPRSSFAKMCVRHKGAAPVVTWIFFVNTGHIAADDISFAATFFTKVTSHSFCRGSFPNRTRCRWAPVWFSFVDAISSVSPFAFLLLQANGGCGQRDLILYGDQANAEFLQALHIRIGVQATATQLGHALYGHGIHPPV